MKRRLKLVTENQPSNLPILKVRGLGKIFHAGDSHHTVLKGIDIDVSTGELLCVLGSSGCGKTTLLKIIAGFMPAGSGTILMNGKPVSTPGPDRCVVFQEDALFPWLTVEENIAFGLDKNIPKRTRRAEVDRFLDLVGLSAFRNYLPANISGGMKQRAALARVLILQPKVLLMDEPFGALDMQTREEMQDLLLALWRRMSHTILFVTHDISEAVTLADRILVMDRIHGQIRGQIRVPLQRPRKKESEAFHRFYRWICGQVRDPLRAR
jgi:NitT/TauT family transport system ATP-binding protein